MDDMACQNCHLKVNRVRRPDGSIYYDHSPQPGTPRHKVVAVHLDAADIIEVCDFCLAPAPALGGPAAESRNHHQDVPEHRGYRY